MITIPGVADWLQSLPDDEATAIIQIDDTVRRAKPARERQWTEA